MGKSPQRILLLFVKVPNLSNMKPVLDLTHKMRQAADSNVSDLHMTFTFKWALLARLLANPSV